MIYTKEYPTHPNVFESYSISDFTVNKEGRTSVSVSIKHVFIDEQTGVLSSELFNELIIDISEYQADPSWSSTSTPPKPEGFDFKDSSTWGGLSINEIPLVVVVIDDSATVISNALDSSSNVEEIVFSKLIEKEKLPAGEGWTLS